MFDVDISIKVEPISETPYQVLVKINIDDSGFLDKMMSYSIIRNVRLGIVKRNIFYRLLAGTGDNDFTAKLITDERKSIDQGYLGDYILNGYVYGFTSEIAAESFASEATKLLTYFLDELKDEYKDAKVSKYYDK